MRGDPVFRAENALCEDAVLRAEIELLGGRNGDVVEAVEESEGMEWWVGFGDWAECFVGDAVGGVDYAFCFFAVEVG
jgi:hypothetical protein